MSKSFVLALDIGSSGGSGGLYDPTRKCMLAVASAPYDYIASPEGFREQNPLNWLAAVGDCVKSLRRAGFDPRSISAIALGAHMHALVPLTVLPGGNAASPKRGERGETMEATYSPEDNKLRLYSTTRLDSEDYARVRAAGFRWAPRQELFVAPAWTPAREDLLLELCGEIGDEDSSLVERAEERAERFGEYSEKREAEAHQAKDAVAAIANGILMGQAWPQEWLSEAANRAP